MKVAVIYAYMIMVVSFSYIAAWPTMTLESLIGASVALFFSAASLKIFIEDNDRLNRMESAWR